MIYLAILIVLFNLFRGIDEGMTMHHGGIRCHGWFEKYHRISILPHLFMFLIGAASAWSAHNIFTPGGLMIIVGSLILSWQVYEAAYSYTRYKTLLPDKENLLGLNIYVDQTALLMILRLMVSAILLIIGGTIS